MGWFKGSGTDYGIRMGNSQVASFQGTVTSPVWWVRGNTVQEQGGSVVWPGAGSTGGLVGEASSFAQSPQANLFFTHCSILGFGDGGRLNHFRDDGGYLIVNAEHSEFYGGACGANAISCLFTNCLLDRVLLTQVQGCSGNAFIFTNCTFHGGSLTLTPYSTAIPIYVHDCALDGTSLSIANYGANSTYANYDYNAFTNTAGKFPIGGAHDQIVTSGFNWQHSWFGYYYLPSASPLITLGDVAANVVGLYYFTTQTSQVPEGSATVDIGYHYVATDGNGNPLDTIVSGTPNYLVAPNGPPVITTQPASQTVVQGTQVTFCVTATGTAPLTYQWKFNGTGISGATSSSYIITSAQTANAGSYSVVVANIAGSVTSSSATLTVTVPPSITAQPLSQCVDERDAVTLSVSATGTPPLTYLWMTNAETNTSLAPSWVSTGATNAKYTIPCFMATNAGTYMVQVSNAATQLNPVQSAPAMLTNDGDIRCWGVMIVQSDRQDYTFRSDTTYTIWEKQNFFGNTTIEGAPSSNSCRARLWPSRERSPA